jgi:hypothetical protein
MNEVVLSKKDQASIERLKVQRRYDAIVRLGGLLIGRGFKWGFFGWLVWQCQIAISAMAGKTTLTSLIVSLGANVSVLVTTSWAVTVGCIVWVFFERRLRKGTVERLTLRIKDLELGLDRGRSSSLLTTRGDTRPEDQV